MMSLLRVLLYNAQPSDGSSKNKVLFKANDVQGYYCFLTFLEINGCYLLPWFVQTL